jgi:hypothetical protein
MPLSREERLNLGVMDFELTEMCITLNHDIK